MKSSLVSFVAVVLLVGCGPPVPDLSIYDATEDGNIEVVKQHLGAGTDVNSKDKDGWTPLHDAAFGSHNEIVQLLIAKGANVNTRNSGGETPLDWAISHRKLKFIEHLMAHGAKRLRVQFI